MPDSDSQVSLLEEDWGVQKCINTLIKISISKKTCGVGGKKSEAGFFSGSLTIYTTFLRCYCKIVLCRLFRPEPAAEGP